MGADRLRCRLRYHLRKDKTNWDVRGAGLTVTYETRKTGAAIKRDARTSFVVVAVNIARVVAALAVA